MRHPPVPAPAPDVACAEVLADAFALADGELPDARAAALRAHARACASCHAALERDAVFVRWVRANAPHPAAPDALRARVRGELDSLVDARREPTADRDAEQPADEQAR